MLYLEKNLSNKLEILNYQSDELDSDDLSGLFKRPDFVVEEVVKTKQISLTDSAKSINLDASSGGIDVEAKVPEVFVARTHPLKKTPLMRFEKFSLPWDFQKFMET